MKLASYADGSRDGHLVVVSRDLTQAHYATGIATRLQQVLDDWGFIAPQLEDLAVQLNHGKLRHAFAFEPETAGNSPTSTTLSDAGVVTSAARNGSLARPTSTRSRSSERNDVTVLPEVERPSSTGATVSSVGLCVPFLTVSTSSSLIGDTAFPRLR